MNSCTLIERGGIFGWCARHGRFHTGKHQTFATGDDPLSVSFRRIWDDSSGVTIALPVCSFRGDFIDSTKCGCVLHACHLHGVCSRNPRAGVKLCQDCTEHATQPLAQCPAIDAPRHTPSSKLLVITVAVGKEGESLHQVTGPSQQRYAERCEADYIAITGESISPAYTMLDKFRVHGYAKLYDRVFYLDADALVRDHCPNVFEAFPPGVVAAHDDTKWVNDKAWDYMREVRQVALSQRLQPPTREQYPLLNSGAFLFDGKDAGIWEPPSRPIPTYWCSEQHLETIRVVNGGHKVAQMNRLWNWMWWINHFHPDPVGEKEAYIIHGAGFTGMGGEPQGRIEWLRARA